MRRLEEVDGQPYLSMEYIDGEDLGSLLRRIGRLPADKALEFARHICAGLAAAHDKGVLHRDLKPCNIMIDSRGHVLITDFGLAAVGELREAQAREGTPAYMAPEQLAGREVTARSDIYALGLVLYEMFAGKRPFEANTLAEMVRLQQSSTPASLSDVAKDVDPAVERVIQRCLAPDPKQRPASALAVAAALPGGDPLAAALAAGETPSPDLVAAAGHAEAMRPAIGLAAMAVIAACLVGALLMSPRVQMFSRVDMPYPPDVLVEKSRDLIRQLGYKAKPAGAAHGFDYDRDFIQFIENTDKSRGRWQQRLGNAQPSAVFFWYRQSPRPLQPESSGSGAVSLDDPSPIISGMVSVTLDPQGRLTEFNVTPPQVDASSPQAGVPDWRRLFDTAGLDMARFSPADPQWTPLGIADTRAAWTGSFPRPGSPTVRVEAAAWRGRPVYFQIIGPWTRPKRMQSFQLSGGMKTVMYIVCGIGAMLLGAVIFFARRNTRSGRGDRRGAGRVATFTLCVYILIWAFGGSHAIGFGEVAIFLEALSYSLLLGALVWLLYLAVEPIARRRWPHSLISWNRLLAGGFRDQLVTHDVVVGVTAGALAAVLAIADMQVSGQFGTTPSTIVLPGALLGARGVISSLLTVIPGSVIEGMAWFVLLFILRVVLRRDWLAAAGFVILFGVVAALAGFSAPAVSAVFAAIRMAILVFVMLRFGLLAFICSGFTVSLLLLFPLTADFAAWYSGASLFAVLVVAAVAAYGFRMSVAGQPLFPGSAA